VRGVDPPDAERVKEYEEFTVADNPLVGVVILGADDIVNVAADEDAVAVVPFKVLVTTTV
jgi:hypothetical protein